MKTTNTPVMHILTAAQTKKWETKTVEAGRETFASLMENAGGAVVHEILKVYPKGSALVLCGPGNNGGDGYVIARKLTKAGWNVTVAFDADSSGRLSPEAQANNDRWTGNTISFEACDFTSHSLIVDALFGTGLERDLTGIYGDVVRRLSEVDIPCVAVDIPSGINSDTGKVMGMAKKCEITISFGSLKRGHVLLPGKTYCGDVTVVDIGFSDLAQLGVKVPFLNSPDLWIDQLPIPKPTDNKYSRGHLLVIGGEKMPGAPQLAAEASRRIGAGMTSIVCQEAAQDIYKKALLGELVRPYKSLAEFEEILNSDKAHGILVGPGLEPNDETRTLVEMCLKTKKPTVVDAGGICCFENQKEQFFSQLHDQCILLPHEGEFKRLFTQGESKIDSALQAARETGATVLLKGSDTVIASPEGDCYVNTNAPPTLSTAGTGDVLAGITAGLLVQKSTPLTSVAAAAWIHGEAATQFGPGLIAEDIIDTIPTVLKMLNP